MVTRKQRKQRNTKRLYLNFFGYYNNFKIFSRICIGCLLIMTAFLAVSIYTNSTTSSIPASTTPYYGQKLSGLLPQGKQILVLGVPGLTEVNRTQNPVKIMPELTASKLSQRVILLMANVDFGDWRSFFSHEIPLMLAFKKPVTPVASAATLPNFPKFDSPSSTNKDKPLVGIYHTHTAESFIPNSGVSHRPGGQLGDIADVGAALARSLEAGGVRALHNKTIHDHPSFMKAYGPSEATAQQMLNDNPSLQMIFDIHRDAEKRENVTAVVNGVQIAKIAIVVATGQQDLPQPHWQQNHAFAKLLEAKLNEKYPGLCRGIQLVEWRYNQHLHPRALLLEVGSQESSKEEALRSMELMADILVEVLAESR